MHAFDTTSSINFVGNALNIVIWTFYLYQWIYTHFPRESHASTRSTRRHITYSLTFELIWLTLISCLQCLSDANIDVYWASLSELIGASLSETHIDKLNVRNLYILWYVRHPRAAIYIVQQLAIYSGGRMKKLLRSPVPCMKGNTKQLVG